MNGALAYDQSHYLSNYLLIYFQMIIVEVLGQSSERFFKAYWHSKIYSTVCL